MVKPEKELVLQLSIYVSYKDIILDFKEFSLDIMNAKHPSQEGPIATINMPLFLTTLPTRQTSKTISHSTALPSIVF
jgi:hypothetical protein